VPGTGDGPWSARDLAGLGIVSALSLAGSVIAWTGISGEVRLPIQARWLGLGIASLLLGGLGMVGWLVIGSARVGALRREVIRELLRIDAGGDSASVEAVGAHRFGTVAGMRRYHREDCQLLTAKTSSWATPRAHAQAGLLPCGICRPPDPESRP
jgi:hypothetical protein